MKICNKVFQQKRKEFNSQAHRIVSTEHKQILMQQKRRGGDDYGGAKKDALQGGGQRKETKNTNTIKG